MAIRIRKIKDDRHRKGFIWIALCAALYKPRDGDIYLDDDIHRALTLKFEEDFGKMRFSKES